MQSRFTFVREISVATKVRILSGKDRSEKILRQTAIFYPSGLPGGDHSQSEK